MRFWLVNGTLHTAISPEPLRADLLVEDGKIPPGIRVWIG